MKSAGATTTQKGEGSGAQTIEISRQVAPICHSERNKSADQIYGRLSVLVELRETLKERKKKVAERKKRRRGRMFQGRGPIRSFLCSLSKNGINAVVC